MEKLDIQNDKIVIYTDASYDDEFKIATYGIVVEINQKIIKQYAKKIQCRVNSSTEAEIYGIYQAMCLINGNYFNKDIKQKIRIKTDCTWAKKFFTSNEYDDMFLHNKKLYDEMKNFHMNLKKRVQKANNSFKIKWLSRNLNEDAHNIAKRQLNMYRKEFLSRMGEKITQ